MKRILAIDDQVGMRVLLEQIFSEIGFPIATVDSGLKALEQWEEYQPDVVLVDMKMPGMTGVEFAKELQKRNYRAQLIMMTAFREEQLLNNARAAGIEHHIIKPFNIDELIDLLKKIGIVQQVS